MSSREQTPAEALLAAIGVEVPRFRGLEAMSEAEPVSAADVEREVAAERLCTAEELIRSTPMWSLNPRYVSLDWVTDAKVRYFMKVDKNRVPTEVKWGRIHGQRRRNLKRALGLADRRVRDYYGAYNSFAGARDVVRVHAKAGSWAHVGGRELAGFANRAAFIRKVDEPHDKSCCDIYLRADPALISSYLEGRAG